MTTEIKKKRILTDFNTMKDFEYSAHKLYTKISSDTEVEDEAVKMEFSRIAEDERRHVEIVEKIIRIITNCL